MAGSGVANQLGFARENFELYCKNLRADALKQVGIKPAPGTWTLHAQNEALIRHHPEQNKTLIRITI